VGRTCRIEVGTRVWNGEEREDIKKIMAPVADGAAAPGPMPAVALQGPVSAPAMADPMAPEVPF
jgi:hypothetical protein